MALDICLQAIEKGYLTVNEARAIEGLPELKKHWQSKYTVGESGPELIILEQRSKIICEYCSRPNELGREICQSCGAPLRYPNPQIDVETET